MRNILQECGVGVKLGTKQLTVYTSELTGPQGSRSAPVGSKNIEKQGAITKFEEAKQKIALYFRVWMRIKAFLLGDKYKYKTQVSQRALEKMNETSQKKFLKLAFGCIALPGNKENIKQNVESLLGFCSDKISPKCILEALYSFHLTKVR
ncbi:MAG: hypothetical protein LBB16_00270 [Puniceicoccales bacterium]|jgi:hypothetical protein|nr:hypothetical protein [Puniceicoccales bacterium]